MSYSFQTVVFETERFVEQRRPLRDTPLRGVTTKYLLESIQAQKFFVRVAYAHDKIMGVPIYNEMLCVETITAGSPTVTFRATTPTTNLYNLNTLATHCAIIDHANGMSEIKEIDTIAANSITFTNNVTATFAANTTFVYPIFFGLVQSASFKSETDSIDSVDIAFKEFESGR